MDCFTINNIRYQRQNQIGKGSFGTVYKCIRQPDYLPVAIKVIDINRLSNVDIQKQLEEIQFLKSTNHPNIITLIDYERTASFFNLVMELCQNSLEDFRDMLDAKDIGPKSIASLFKQIVLALQEVHFRGLMHRDIKKENILLKMTEQQRNSIYCKQNVPETCDQITVKLIDFGIAKRLDTQFEMSQTFEFIDSPIRAPETVYGAYGIESDIFQLGQVLFYLLRGRYYEPTQELNPLESGYKWLEDLSLQMMEKKQNRINLDQVSKVLDRILLDCDRLIYVSSELGESSKNTNYTDNMQSLQNTEINQVSGQFMQVEIQNYDHDPQEENQKIDDGIFSFMKRILKSYQEKGIDTLSLEDDLSELCRNSLNRRAHEKKFLQTLLQLSSMAPETLHRMMTIQSLDQERGQFKKYVSEIYPDYFCELHNIFTGKDNCFGQTDVQLREVCDFDLIQECLFRFIEDIEQYEYVESGICRDLKKIFLVDIQIKVFGMILVEMTELYEKHSQYLQEWKENYSLHLFDWLEDIFPQQVNDLRVKLNT